jgi:hypothetical protein
LSVTRGREIRTAALAVAAAVLLAVLYGVWWQTLANRWTGGIAAWTGSVAASGWTATTGPLSVSGFPGPIHIALPTPVLSDAAGNGWTGPPATILVSPWAPFDPGFAAPGAHRFVLAGHAPVALSAEALDGRIAVADGQPVAIEMTLTDAGAAGLKAAAATLTAHRLAPLPAGGDTVAPVLAATITLAGLTVPEGWAPVLDRTMTNASLSLRLRGAAPHGSATADPVASALAAWRDAGGTVEIDALDFAWPPLWANGNATLALDRDLQPELAGTFTMRGIAAAIDRAGAQGLVPPAAAITAKLTLGLTASQTSDGAAENKLAVTVQDRVLSVGPVPLLNMPEVKW